MTEPLLLGGRGAPRLADQRSAPGDGATIAPDAQPLVHTGKLLLKDFVSTLVFVALYAATHSVLLAVGVSVALGLGEIGVAKWRSHPIDAMQWLTLGLIVVFGGASLLTHDPVLAKLQPTLIYGAVGAVMLRRGWMTRYLPPIARANAADVTIVFGYVWSALMFATGASNLAIAALASNAAWSWFIATVPLTSKFVMIGLQYGVTRFVVARRLRA